MERPRVNLSIITTCKNRLGHLKRTISYMLDQSDSELIVVDYGCNEGTAEWVQINYPSVKVVKFSEDPVFSLAIARNLGLKEATGKWVLFVDADVYIVQDIGLWLTKHEKLNVYYRIKKTSELTGTFICEKSVAQLINGYDEAFRGWGGGKILTFI